GLEGRVRAICKDVMLTAGDLRDVEFCHDVAGLVPSQVVGELVGIPKEDWPQIRVWAEQATSSQDPDLAGPDSYTDEGMVDMAMYAIAFAQRRRGEPPRADLASLI